MGQKDGNIPSENTDLSNTMPFLSDISTSPNIFEIFLWFYLRRQNFLFFAPKLILRQSRLKISNRNIFIFSNIVSSVTPLFIKTAIKYLNVNFQSLNLFRIFQIKTF